MYLKRELTVMIFGLKLPSALAHRCFALLMTRYYSSNVITDSTQGEATIHPTAVLEVTFT